MAAPERWYFTKKEIETTPSRRCGIDSGKELSYRQREAELIQEMGQKLKVSQLVINTAIVYMHRFYMFHPFTQFPRNTISPAALFLAAKVEEQPRKLEHVIRIANNCLSLDQSHDLQSEGYLEKSQELVMNENILLQTLGFDVAIDHPHTHVVKFFQMARMSGTDLPQYSYIMATNSLHTTTMCLQYKPAVVACVCINFMCKWSGYEIQRFNESAQEWFFYIDKCVTAEMIEAITNEYVDVTQKFPDKIKKLMNFHLGNNSLDGNSRHSGGSLSKEIMPPLLPSVSMKPGLSKVLQQTSSKTLISPKEYSEKRAKEKHEKEREREQRPEHRERHQHHMSSSASSGASRIPAVPSSTNALPGIHPSAPPNCRLQPPEVLHARKPHPDHPRPVHGFSGRPVVGVPFRGDSHRRDHPANVRSDDAMDRTSKSLHPKFVHDKVKSSVYRHPNESVHSRNNSVDLASKDRKLDIKVENKNDYKDIKLINAKEVRTEQRAREVKPNVIPKVEFPLKLKHEQLDKDIKSELKDDIKTEKEVKYETKEDNKFKIEIKEEVKTNSFIFNNNNFLFRDFLNPTDLPPDDIFDTDVDSKNANLEFVSPPTTHHKLKSPPKPVSANPLGNYLESPIVNNVAAKPPLKTPAAEKPAVEQTPQVVTSSESKSSKQPINFLKPAVDKLTPASAGATSVSTPVSSRTLPPHKVDSSKDPRALLFPPSGTTFKPKPQSHLPIVNSSQNDHKLHISKEVVSFKDSVDGSAKSDVAHHSGPLETPDKHVHTSLTAKQPPPVSAELVKTETIKVKLPRPDAEGSLSKSASVVGTLPPPAFASAVPPSIFDIGSKKKSEHHHKKKKEKKSKHKEHKDRDKHKERKEHKDHKKKKHKKHKDKDKEREKGKISNSKEDPEGGSLKLTIVRDKGIYTPEIAPSVTRIASTTPLGIPHNARVSVSDGTPSSSSALDTPGRIKITIPKSYLQANTPASASPSKSESSSMKLKIHRDQIIPDKKSRKREREEYASAEQLNPSKISRSHPIQQVGKMDSSFSVDHTKHKQGKGANLSKSSFQQSQPITHFHTSAPHNPQVPYIQQVGQSSNSGDSKHVYQVLPPDCGGAPSGLAHVQPLPYHYPYEQPYPIYYTPGIQLPNLNVPPPSYQASMFTVPPPGYSAPPITPQQMLFSHLTLPAKVPATQDPNPPLPSEPPPERPPEPPE